VFDDSDGDSDVSVGDTGGRRRVVVSIIPYLNNQGTDQEQEQESGSGSGSAEEEKC